MLKSYLCVEMVDPCDEHHPIRSCLFLIVVNDFWEILVLKEVSISRDEHVWYFVRGCVMSFPIIHFLE